MHLETNRLTRVPKTIATRNKNLNNSRRANCVEDWASTTERGNHGLRSMARPRSDIYTKKKVSKFITGKWTWIGINYASTSLRSGERTENLYQNKMKDQFHRKYSYRQISF